MRHLAGALGPVPPFLGPPRDRLRIGPGFAAQVRSLPYERLVELTFRRALEDPGDLGGQVGSAARDGTEFGHGGGFLLLHERAPLGVMPGLAGELGHDHPICIGAGTILVHLAKIEHGYEKSKLASAMRPALTR